MQLLLTVLSPQRLSLGDRATCTFGPAGGTLGRSRHCDWPLPDDRSVLSARHARISHNGLGFSITDTSTNGVYVNTVETPLGRDRNLILADGDIIYIAEYVIGVTVRKAAVGVAPSDATEPVPRPAAGLPQGVRHARPSIPAEFDWGDLAREPAVTPPGGHGGLAGLPSGASGSPAFDAAPFWEALGLAPTELRPEARDQLLRTLGFALRDAAAILATERSADEARPDPVKEAATPAADPPHPVRAGEEEGRRASAPLLDADGDVGHSIRAMVAEAYRPFPQTSWRKAS